VPVVEAQLPQRAPRQCVQRQPRRVVREHHAARSLQATHFGRKAAPPDRRGALSTTAGRACLACQGISGLALSGFRSLQ
jgi:hypothetical protein